MTKNLWTKKSNLAKVVHYSFSIELKCLCVCVCVFCVCWCCFFMQYVWLDQARRKLFNIVNKIGFLSRNETNSYSFLFEMSSLFIKFYRFTYLKNLILVKQPTYNRCNFRCALQTSENLATLANIHMKLMRISF